jgi:hypothetical protein
VVGSVVLGAARDARADEGDRWKVAAGVATDFPVDVAARLAVETPFRLRLNTQIGFLPGPYVSAMNGILEGFGAYDSSTGDLIKSALQSSFVWRTHVGYRPFRKLGLYADAGYGLVTLGGNATTAQLVTAVTGATYPATETGADKSFDAKATLHMLDVEIGYDIPIASPFELRAALGGAFTLGSSTTLTPDFTPRSPRAVDAFVSAGESYLNTTFRSYVFTPVLTLGASYVF